MPIAAPIVAALIGLAGTGVTTGLQASGALTGGGGTPQPTPAQLAESVAAQKNAVNATVSNNQGTINQNSSFGLSPDYTASQLSTQTGGGDITSLQDILKQFTGGGSGSSDLTPSDPAPLGSGGLSA